MPFSANVFGAFDVLDCLSMIGVKLFILPDYFVPLRQTNKQISFFPLRATVLQMDLGDLHAV